LSAHSGSAPVQVRFLSSQGVTPLEVGTFRVNAGAGLLSELRGLLGKDAAKVIPRNDRDQDTVRVPDVAPASR
jgi:hypothetical protein